jgi:hypothetical protein
MPDEWVTQWLTNRKLAANCAIHARLFLGNADIGLTTARHGQFTPTPTPPMRDALRADYVAMAGMIFGDVPMYRRFTPCSQPSKTSNVA